MEIQVDQNWLVYGLFIDGKLCQNGVFTAVNRPYLPVIPGAVMRYRKRDWIFMIYDCLGSVLSLSYGPYYCASYYGKLSPGKYSESNRKRPYTDRTVRPGEVPVMVAFEVRIAFKILLRLLSRFIFRTDSLTICHVSSNAYSSTSKRLSLFSKHL